jgi:hypothetical protein
VRLRRNDNRRWRGHRLAEAQNNARFERPAVDGAEVAAVGGGGGVIAEEPDSAAGGGRREWFEAGDALDERPAGLARYHHLPGAGAKPAPAQQRVAGLVGGQHAIAGHAVEAEGPKMAAGAAVRLFWWPQRYQRFRQ